MLIGTKGESGQSGTLPALTASVLGMTSSASANSAMASCSRLPSVLANDSRYMASAASTAPPPVRQPADEDISSSPGTTTSRGWRLRDRPCTCMQKHTASK